MKNLIVPLIISKLGPELYYMPTSPVNKGFPLQGTDGLKIEH